jgi:hypothetical protein
MTYRLEHTAVESGATHVQKPAAIARPDVDRANQMVSKCEIGCHNRYTRNSKRASNDVGGPGRDDCGWYFESLHCRRRRGDCPDSTNGNPSTPATGPLGQKNRLHGFGNRDDNVQLRAGRYTRADCVKDRFEPLPSHWIGDDEV